MMKCDWWSSIDGVSLPQVGGESGSADTARDPRGFAVKFYSEEGNWDLVGNNTPVFFIRDPILFPRSGEAHASMAPPPHPVSRLDKQDFFL